MTASTNVLRAMRRFVAHPYGALAIVLIALAVSWAVDVWFGYIVVAVIGGIAAVYSVFRRILSARFFRSKVLIAVTSLVGWMGLLQVVAYSVSSSSLFASVLLLQVFVSAIAFAVRNKEKPEIPSITLPDVASIIAAVLLVSLVSVLPLRHAAPTGESTVLTLINTSPDDSNHLGMLNDRLQFKKAVLTDEIVEGVTRGGGVGYPTGWHSANAVVILSVDPDIRVGYESAVAYVVTKLVWTGILVYLMGAAAISLIPSNTRQRANVAYVVLLSSTLFGAWFVSDVLEHGFYNYIGILATVPLCLLALAQLATSRHLSEALWGLVLPISLTAISALSWLLVAPIFAASTIIVFFSSIRLRELRRLVKDRANLVPLAVVTVLVLLLLRASVSQIGLTATGSEYYGGMFSSLLATGAVSVYPIGFYLVILCGLVPFLRMALKADKHQKSAETGVVFLTVALGFAVVVYAIQMYYAQELRYYFYKSLYIGVFAAIVLAIAGAAHLVSRSDLSRSLTACLSSLSLIASILFFYPDPHVISYVRQDHLTTPGLSRWIEDKLRASEDPAMYAAKELDVVSTPQGDADSAQIAIRLLRSNRPYNDCDQQMYLLFTFTASDQVTVSDLDALQCADYTVNIYVPETETGHFTQLLAELGKSNFVLHNLPTE